VDEWWGVEDEEGVVFGEGGGGDELGFSGEEAGEVEVHFGEVDLDGGAAFFHGVGWLWADVRVEGAGGGGGLVPVDRGLVVEGDVLWELQRDGVGETEAGEAYAEVEVSGGEGGGGAGVDESEVGAGGEGADGESDRGVAVLGGDRWLGVHVGGVVGWGAVRGRGLVPGEGEGEGLVEGGGLEEWLEAVEEWLDRGVVDGLVGEEVVVCEESEAVCGDGGGAGDEGGEGVVGGEVEGVDLDVGGEADGGGGAGVEGEVDGEAFWGVWWGGGGGGVEGEGGGGGWCCSVCVGDGPGDLSVVRCDVLRGGGPQLEGVWEGEEVGGVPAVLAGEVVVVGDVGAAVEHAGDEGGDVDGRGGVEEGVCEVDGELVGEVRDGVDGSSDGCDLGVWEAGLELVVEAVSEAEFDGDDVVAGGVVFDLVLGVGIAEDVVDLVDEHAGGDVETCAGFIGGGDGGIHDAGGGVVRAGDWQAGEKEHEG